MRVSSYVGKTCLMAMLKSIDTGHDTLRGLGISERLLLSKEKTLETISKRNEAEEAKERKPD